MKALVRFYYGIVWTPFLICSVADLAADLTKEALWIFPIVQVFAALMFCMFISLLVISAGGWLRLRAILRTEPDRTKCCWIWCRLSNAWQGTLNRFWLCQLIFVKPITGFVLAILHNHDHFVHTSNLAKILSIVSLCCTILPTIGIAMFTYTLGDLVEIKSIGWKTSILRLLAPATQFIQTILELCVAHNLIKPKNGLSGIDRAHELLSLCLSISMLFISLLNLRAYRAKDFETRIGTLTEERLLTLSAQRSRADSGSFYFKDEITPGTSPSANNREQHMASRPNLDDLGSGRKPIL